MILGIGIDLVPVERMRGTLRRHGKRAIGKLFTPGEVERARSGADPDASFAARFAAKEAFFKALGTGWGRGGRWTDVEVVSAPSGAPSLRLSGAARAHADAMGVTRIHLSLTHTDALAAAYLVLEASTIAADP